MISIIYNNFIWLSGFEGAEVQGPKCLEIIRAARRVGK